MKHLSIKYNIEDPLTCLRRDPPEKSQYKEYVNTKISAYYENELRLSAKTNSKMTYLNISVAGLRGRPHPALSGQLTSKDVKNSRIHLKMLVGDYMTYSIRASQSGGSPHCRCCSSEPSKNEDLLHILTICNAYTDIRNRLIPEYQNLCLETRIPINFEDISSQDSILCQFILDPSSFNLKVRVNLNDPILDKFFKLSRDFCNAINKRRMEIIQAKEIE